MFIYRIGRIINRGIRLKCPRCGEGSLFYGFFSMYQRCPQCAFEFEREQGYFVGAIYINYAATALSALSGFLILDAYTSLSLSEQLVLWGTFAVLFPVWFFRYSRSLWVSIGYVCSAPQSSSPKKPVTLRRTPDQ